MHETVKEQEKKQKEAHLYRRATEREKRGQNLKASFYQYMLHAALLSIQTYRLDKAYMTPLSLPGICTLGLSEH